MGPVLPGAGGPVRRRIVRLVADAPGVERREAGRRFADILGGEREPAQRDLPDERFGPGGRCSSCQSPRRVASARRERRSPAALRLPLTGWSPAPEGVPDRSDLFVEPVPDARAACRVRDGACAPRAGGAGSDGVADTALVICRPVRGDEVPAPVSEQGRREDRVGDFRNRGHRARGGGSPVPGQAHQEFEEIGRGRSLTRHVASGFRLNPVTMRLRIETKVMKIQ